MKYEWDENKRESNLEKHGWDFKDAHKAWDSGAPVIENFSERKGEDRYEATGRIEGKTVFIVYEDKGPDLRRLISFRTADREERQMYEREIGRELGREDPSLDRIFDSISQEREITTELNRQQQLELGNPQPQIEKQPDRKLLEREDRER